MCSLHFKKECIRGIKSTSWVLTREDRYFAADPAQRKIARQLYHSVKKLPLICPHGHVDPHILAVEQYEWGTPVDLLIIPDHYVFRMLYSQWYHTVVVGSAAFGWWSVETDHRKIWQTVCDHWYLFRGTPTSLWLRDELQDIFGIDMKISSANAQELYSAIAEKLRQPEFQLRRLFERFNIEVLATTDPATSELVDHQRLCASGWSGRVIPTLRPDAVVNIQAGYDQQIQQLSQVSSIDIVDYRTYISALEQRRHFFKEMGATATDHSAQSAYTERLSEREADTIFQRALKGKQVTRMAVDLPGIC